MEKRDATIADIDALKFSPMVAKQLKQQLQIAPMSLADLYDAATFLSAPSNMSKRERAGAFNSLSAKRAYWANRKFSRAQPWSTYGAARMQRGTAENLERFGATAKSATPAQRARRRMMGYTGRGSYFGKGLDALRSAGRSLGLRADRNSKIGKAYRAAKGVDKVIDMGLDFFQGRGSYTTHPRVDGVNDLIVGGPRSTPTMSTVSDETGSIVISHTERVADVIAPADDKFHVQTFAVNPGVEATFSWLSQIAASFEEYEIIQMIFSYKGHEMVGSGGTSLDLNGQVIAATQHNPKSRPFHDRHAMMAYPHATHCSMNGTLTAGVEADPSKTSGDDHKLVRVGGLRSAEDLRDYDHSRFELALNNTPTDLQGKEVGQLFVSYTVKLIKPKIHAGRGRAISQYRQRGWNQGNLMDQVFCFGTKANDTLLVASENTLAMTYDESLIVSSGIHRWVFPPHANGLYRIQILVRGNLQEIQDVYQFTYDGNVRVYFTDMLPGNTTSMSPGGTDGPSNSYWGSLGVVTNQGDQVTVAGNWLVGYALVRPQVGATTNKIGVFTRFAGDDQVRESAIVIEEVNSFGDEDDNLGRVEYQIAKTGAVATSIGYIG